MIALAFFGYALVELVDAHVIIAPIVFAVTCFIMIGLQQIAIAMSDPFGDDEVDFDLQSYQRSAYDR